MVKKFAPKIYLLVILALLYAPIIFVMVFSFSNTTNFTFPKGISFEGYKAIFTSSHAPKLMDSLKNTLVIALISSVISTILGAISAVGIFHMKSKVKTAVENINQLPIVNSEIVMAISLMLFFTTFTFPTGWVRLIIGHITFCTPYVILSIMPKLIQMDPNIYEAALDLGASPIKALFRVIIPIIMPGIISGGAIAFTLSIDDFIITQINKGAATGIDTLSTYLYSSMRNASGFAPFWYPLSTILITLIVTIVLLSNFNKLKAARKKSSKTHVISQIKDI